MACRRIRGAKGVALAASVVLMRSTAFIHIARCPIAVNWAARFSHLRNAPVDSELDFMLCLSTEALDPDQSFHLADRDEMMITRAIHLYALYKVHNQCRHGSLPSGDLAGAYRQHLVEGRLAVHIELSSCSLSPSSWSRHLCPSFSYCMCTFSFFEFVV